MSWASLALLLPILLGGWVPVFTWLARWGHRWTAPLIGLALGSLVVLAYLFGDQHDVSRASERDADGRATREVAVAARDGIGESVRRWKQANCAGDACPRPIIISTAGGASRAAFFTVTVLGDLLDHPYDPNPPVGDREERSRRARAAANRIFAISGVSGGAMGAAFFSGALANSPDMRPPCRDKESSFWFRTGAPQSWRDCLQVLVSEDYLSATILGLTFRDNFNFIAKVFPWPDRAAALEKGWIDRFASWIEPPPSGLLGLERRFSEFGPKGLPAGGWRPLLVLNGTSVSTGRRILTSHLAPEGERIFMDAYDLYEILSGRPACDGRVCTAPGGQRDVTLASAATNSARFPIISPAGTLKKEGSGEDAEPADRIVDGGYFENDGMTTTIDLVRALRHHGLRPSVVHIANDPLPYPRSRVGKDGQAEDQRADWKLDSPVAPKVEDRSVLFFLRAPIGSLLATRTARTSYALTDLQLELENRGDLAEILVYAEPRKREAEFIAKAGCVVVPPSPDSAEFKNVSMSWWLSQPVQQYLDTQLLLERNCRELDRIRGWLKETSVPTAARTEARPPG